MGGDGDVAPQPKKALSLDEAGDLGSGLLRLLWSSDVADVVAGSGTSLVFVVARFRCGGGDLRANKDMVLVGVLMTAAGGSFPCGSGEADESGEPGME